MKKLSVALLCSLLLSTPLYTYAAEVDIPQAASVDVVPDDPEESILDDSDSDTDTDAATTSASQEDATDFQQSLLDKLDVIIYLLTVISAAGILFLISLIARFLGWIVANIFKEIY